MATTFMAGEAVVARFNGYEHAGVIVAGPRMVKCGGKQYRIQPAPLPKYTVTFTIKSTGAVKTREIWGCWIRPAQEVEEVR
jgi:hypothetical protein